MIKNKVTNVRQAPYFKSIPQNLSTMEQSGCMLPQSRWPETLQQKYLNLLKVPFPSY